MATSTYPVTGMTCEHCVRAVTEEVRRIEGVADVMVDLPTGALTISSSQPVEEAAVAEAVEQAGYRLAAR
jgi:copper ion binding protein